MRQPTTTADVRLDEGKVACSGITRRTMQQFGCGQRRWRPNFVAVRFDEIEDQAQEAGNPGNVGLVHPDGATETIAIDRVAARALYEEAFKSANSAGLALSTEPLRLTPQDKLVEIVRRSQDLALRGEGGEEGEAGDGQ